MSSFNITFPHFTPTFTANLNEYNFLFFSRDTHRTSHSVTVKKLLKNERVCSSAAVTTTFPCKVVAPAQIDVEPFLQPEAQSPITCACHFVWDHKAPLICAVELASISKYTPRSTNIYIYKIFFIQTPVFTVVGTGS